jgi:hypothetical protein
MASSVATVSLTDQASRTGTGGSNVVRLDSGRVIGR